MRQAQFYEGDQVEIRSNRSEWSGRTGVVVECYGADIMVRIGTARLVFDPSELRLISSPERRAKWWNHRR